MDLIRIGEKLVDKEKIYRAMENALTLRSQGLSQQETAKKLNLDRSFISRMETLGEIRKGRKLGIFGFPLQNKEEIVAIIENAGFDFHLLMTDAERWEFVKERSGMDFFNEVMQLIYKMRECDTLLILGSSKWIKLAEALFETQQVLYIEIGDTPIEKDVYLDSEVLKNLLKDVAIK